MTGTDWIRLLLMVPLLAWLPGALVWKAFGSRVPLDRSERLLAEVVTSLWLTTFLATFLAELGLFSLVSLLAGLVLIYLALGRRLESKGWRLEVGDWRPAPIPNLQSLLSSWTLGFVATLVLAAILFFRPAEAYLVTDDAGVYVIHGLTLGRTGGLVIRDSLLPSLSLAPDQIAELFRYLPYEASFLRFQGFYIWHWWRGLVQPSFFHLPPIWMAILVLLGGARAAVWATPLAGLVSVAAMALLGRRLFGPAIGLVATLLLTVSFPQVWYARYPTSEMFTQAWLLGGLFLLTLFLRHRTPFLGVLAGIGLGQLLLARVDAWVAALAIGLCFGGWAVGGRHTPSPKRQSEGDRWFLVPLGLTLAWASLHAMLFATPYVVSLMHLYLTPRLTTMAILGGAFVAIACFVILHRSGAVRLGARHEEDRLAVQLTRLGAVSKLSPLPRWIRGPFFPRASATLDILTSQAPLWVLGLLITIMWAVVMTVGTRAPVGSEAIRWLGWYFTLPGLGAALVGLVMMARQGIPRSAQPMLLIALLYALLYLPAPRANPVQPWGVRRLVPVVIPVLVLGMAYLTVRLPLPGPEGLRRVIRTGLVLLLALALARNIQPVLTHEEYAGVWEQVEALAERFEPEGVVLFNRTGVGEAVAQPLTYLHDRPAFVLQAEMPDPEVVEELATRWVADGRPVYLALTGLAPWLADLDIGIEPVGEFTLRFPRLERSSTHLPREVRMVVWPIDLYRLIPRASQRPVTRLDMELGELPYLRRGFYERETTPDGTTFRWTDGAAQISLPVSQGVTELTLRVAGPPSGVPRPTLMVLLDGQLAGTWKLPEAFVTFSMTVPPAATEDGRLEIELRSDTWVPRQVGRGEDGRVLGVVVDWIAVTGDPGGVR